MEDPLNHPEARPPEQTVNSDNPPAQVQDSQPVAEESAELAPASEPAFVDTALVITPSGAAAWRRNFRHNIFLLLALTLAAFTLTEWVLVRVDTPFGIFSSGPQEIVRAQLRALNQGELLPAYNMFSERYRGQVPFVIWHQLIVTHWRMFHAQVLRAGVPANDGPDVTMQIYLHSDDGNDYRANFTLIRTGGRWWIDDVHWSEEPDERDFTRT
ncbi:MAG TPA: hypothetical protein VNI36_02015 [Candidatus Dormibacteraeota bacterium]|nr:hypothetical protein [Candidatus Dormibacteraeota bacterium]